MSLSGKSLDWPDEPEVRCDGTGMIDVTDCPGCPDCADGLTLED